MESDGRNLRKAQWLATIVLMLAVVGLGGLVGRVFWLEKRAGQAEAERLNRQHLAVASVLPDRGTIYMADGTAVAASVRLYNLFADPAYIMDPEDRVGKLEKQQKKLTEQMATTLGPERAELEKQYAELTQKIRETEKEVLDDTKLQKGRDQLAEALAPLLGKPAGEVLGMIEANQRYVRRDGTEGAPRRFLWLTREVDEGFHERFMAKKAELREQAKEIAQGIKGIKDKAKREEERERASVLYHTLDGVGFAKSIKRRYPLGTLAGPVIGYANSFEGVDAAEKQLDPLLMGRPGQMLLLKDASRHTLEVEEAGYKDPDHGWDVWLTLDTVVQGIAEDELSAAVKQFKAESGCAIVMDPFTGRILAMANCPTYDPARYATVNKDERRNKCITDPYEPGSIFKPFVAAMALEKHVVGPETVIDCHFGHWTDPTGRAVTDVHGYGALSVQDVLVKSSNIGMAQIGWRMGIPLVHEAVAKFGFGERTGVELPGDQKGLVTPLERWNKGTLTSVSFGYEVGATPLQLVRAYGTFANGGYLVTPRILHAVEVKPGEVRRWSELAGPGIEKQIITTETALAMRKMMEGVYTYGTAKSARSKYYRLFGKTGTAHLAVRGAAHYAGDQYNSSFLAGGPMTQPRLVAVMTLHKPDRSLGHFGGTVAAPACSRMLERSLMYLQVPADQAPEKPEPRRVLAER